VIRPGAPSPSTRRAGGPQPRGSPLSSSCVARLALPPGAGGPHPAADRHRVHGRLALSRVVRLRRRPPVAAVARGRSPAPGSAGRRLLVLRHRGRCDEQHPAGRGGRHRCLSRGARRRRAAQARGDPPSILMASALDTGRSRGRRPALRVRAEGQGDPRCDLRSGETRSFPLRERETQIRGRHGVDTLAICARDGSLLSGSVEGVERWNSRPARRPGSAERPVWQQREVQPVGGRRFAGAEHDAGCWDGQITTLLVR